MAAPLPLFLHLTSIFEHESGKGKGERGRCVVRLSCRGERAGGGAIQAGPTGDRRCCVLV